MEIQLRSGESIIKIVRRYGLTYFWQWFLVFIFIVAPFFFMFWLFSRGWWGIVIFSISLAIGLLILIRLFYFWRRNLLMITTERVVDVYQPASLNKIVTEVSFDKIHHISYQVKGIFPTIFGYGAIKVNTIGGDTDLEFVRVKNPVKVKEIISLALQNYQSRTSAL